jgi:Txe/YoeB family toxin of Txe-Axe toxin-antitoxin module
MLNKSLNDFFYWRKNESKLRVVRYKNKMGRSVKKNPFTGYTTSESEKQDKQHANRKYRRKIKVLLTSTMEETKNLGPLCYI